MTTRAHVIAYLSRLSGGEFADVVSEVLANRPESYRLPHEESSLQLASVYRLRDEDENGTPFWDDWSFSLIACADPAEYGPEWLQAGEPFAQQGRCANCDVEVFSHVKGALCPLCGNEVWLT